MQTEWQFGPDVPPFQEAVDAFLSKGIMSRREFDGLAAAMRAKTFTVAHVHAADQLQRVYDATLKAIAKGTTLAEFKRDTEDILTKPWHRETVLRTNVLAAYGKGHWDQAQSPKDMRPYARYSAVMDGRTRPRHAVLHGLIYPLDHPFWKMYWPPWDYNCRCGAVTLSQEQIDRDKLEVSQKMDNLPQPKNDFVSPAAWEDWKPDWNKYQPPLADGIAAKVAELPKELYVGRGQMLPGRLIDVHKGVEIYVGNEVVSDGAAFSQAFERVLETLDWLEKETVASTIGALNAIVQEVRIWDRVNPLEKVARELYGVPGESPYSGGKGTLNVWRSAWRDTADQSRYGMAHEYGHNLAYKVTGKKYYPREWADITMREGWTTQFSQAAQDLGEDFAETVAKYLTIGPASTELASFPIKKAVIGHLLGKQGLWE